MDGRPERNWFAELRRDGGLFATVAALLLVANLLAPGPARAGEIVCTLWGAVPAADEGRVVADGAHCLAGHCVSPLPTLAPALPVAGSPALSVLGGGQSAKTRTVRQPRSGAADRIRAPPVAS
jgi:hypothetical protein